MRRVPLAPLFVLLLASVAAAQSPIRCGNEFVVNTYTYYIQMRPDVSAAPDGSFVVVWQSFETSDGFPSDVLGQRFDSVGARQGGEFAVPDAVARPDVQNRPSVAVADDGSFVVAFSSDFEGAVVAKRYSTTGAPLGSEFVVREAPGYGYEYGASVATGPAGSFVVSWTRYPFADGDDSGVLVRRFDSAGTPQGGEAVVNTYTTGFQSFSDVAVMADGSFIVVWEDQERAAVVGRRFDSGGTPLGGEFTASPSPTAYPDPAVAPAADGSFVVVWDGVSDGDGYGVFARRYDSAGASVGGAFLVNTTTTGSQERGVVTPTPDGGFVVAWFSSSQGPDEYGEGVVGRRYDSAGAPLGGEFVVTRNEGQGGYSAYKRELSLAGAADGTFTVVWRSTYTYGGGPDIIGQRYFNGTVGCSATPRTDCREPTAARRGIFRFKDASNDRQDRLVWQWAKGEATAADDFGDPFSNTAYALCAYDGSLSTQPIVSAISPAQGSCGQRLCWQPLTGGFAFYQDRSRTSDGLEQIRLKAGAAGSARVGVRGAGPKLSLPATPLTPPVVVQLQGSNGECWSATYSSTILANGGGLVRARPDGP